MTAPKNDKRTIHLDVPADLLAKFDALRASKYPGLARLGLIKSAMALAIDAPEEHLSKHVGRY